MQDHYLVLSEFLFAMHGSDSLCSKNCMVGIPEADSVAQIETLSLLQATKIQLQKLLHIFMQYKNSRRADQKSYKSHTLKPFA